MTYVPISALLKGKTALGPRPIIRRSGSSWLLLTVLAVVPVAGAEAPEEQESFLETGIGPVRLGDTESFSSTFGTDVELMSEGVHNYYRFQNRSGSQLLTVTVHPGGMRFTADEFRVERVSKTSPQNWPRVDWEMFRSGKGIYLGLPMCKVIEILGKPTSRTPEKLRYELSGESPFLSRYNAVGYFGEYVFETRRLIAFSFGFMVP